MLNKKNGLIILIFALILSTSCKKEFTTIGNQLIDTPHFEGKLFDATQVRIYDRRIDRVFSTELNAPTPYTYNNLPHASLGFYNDQKFGVLKADLATAVVPDRLAFANDFGENITVLGSKLILPYFSHKTPSNEYELDSIFGYGALDIKIYELTYQLNSYDPDTNLEDRQVFFSDFDFSPYKGDVVGEVSDFQISNEPYYEYKRNSDGTFELDDDGEKIVKDSLSPRMVIDLDNDFFKQKIFDHSGEDVLTNLNIFKDYFRGLYIEALETSNNHRLIQFPLNDAKILLEYTYEVTDDNGTPNDDSDDTVETKYREIKMSLSAPRVNHYENTLTSDAQTALDNSDLINGDEEIYLKGDAGSEAVIQLFNEQQLKELRESDWMINQAELYVYVDKTQSGQMIANPGRLFIYNYDRVTFIDDAYGIYPENKDNNYLSLDGHLQEDGSDTYYKFNITRHIRNVIKNDSANTRLALRVVPETYPQIIKMKEVFMDPDAFMPHGTILYGNQSATKPPVLKIYYTDPE